MSQPLLLLQNPPQTEYAFWKLVLFYTVWNRMRQHTSNKVESLKNDTPFTLLCNRWHNIQITSWKNGILSAYLCKNQQYSKLHWIHAFLPTEEHNAKKFFNLTLLAHDFCNFIKVSNLNKKSAFNIIANLQKACQASIPFNAVVRHWIKLFLVQILHFKTTMVQKNRRNRQKWLFV